MKKSVFCASILAAGFAFADSTEITCDNVLGVMPISITNTQLILSVPWVQPGGGDAIAVSNFVKTAGLTAEDGTYNGDTLTWYDGSTGEYNVWSLVSDASGTNRWQAVDMVGNDNVINVNPTNAVLKQGNAVVLTRASSNETVYVIGQVGTNSTITTTVAANAISLIAPPGSLDGVFEVNHATKGIKYVEGAPVPSTYDEGKNRITEVGDLLIRENVGGLTASFVYYNGTWRPSYDISEENVVVPAGCGIWYKRKANTPMTISWSAKTVGN